MAFDFDPFALLDASTSMLNTATTNAANLKLGKNVNETNLQIARETNANNALINQANIELQQKENEIARQREDNAVRRRVNDLVGAGLSKTLAAGSPASANAMQAPQATIGMQTGHEMKAPKMERMYETDFSTAMARKKQNEIAEQSLDLENERLTYEREVLAQRKAEAEETRRHNEALETSTKSSIEESARHNKVEEEIARQANDITAKYHDEALKIQKASLDLEREDFISVNAQREIMNTVYDAQAKIYQKDGEAYAMQLAAGLAESAARTASLLASADLDKKQIEYLGSNIEKIAAETAEAVARALELDAQTQYYIQQALTEEYNRTIAEAEGIPTTAAHVSESVASQNKAQRHTELAKTAITSVSTIVGVGVGAFLGAGGGAGKIMNKMFGFESKLDPADFVR